MESNRFSLHANVSCARGERKKRGRLCRYIARPPIAHERLKLSDCGQVVYELKTPYRDGTTHVVMSPLEWMQRLAALIPRPRLHLTRYHGVLAPNAKWRAQVVPKPKAHDTAELREQDYEAKRNYIPWARLLKRVFALDLEHCPTCNGPLKLIAVIEQAAVIEKILTHLGLQAHPPPRLPARYDLQDEAGLYWNPATSVLAMH